MFSEQLQLFKVKTNLSYFVQGIKIKKNIKIIKIKQILVFIIILHTQTSVRNPHSEQVRAELRKCSDLIAS
jgi:Tfp pilus assembly protein PilP